ncbi:hypothetical protein CHLNCDRAFT_141863 [Chlorella variabilis]|uniref:Uncharacterized protein n=1 Tax=Chlorella variabilis TaxID=554065 RepID=E1Z778_CHLVA|nr:hypothetical protein CHLNCDRAFT_141863 [Chlorella variabilis]EFN58124.1 hypothetical protein CHLNCDRAFT_141863 [Chlorella variabilis]|eukprot:XP_005850226.1 hypothetical protein CHLNCDRAFT_141863 [Chlorella variabilis]
MPGQDQPPGPAEAGLVARVGRSFCGTGPAFLAACVLAILVLGAPQLLAKGAGPAQHLHVHVHVAPCRSERPSRRGVQAQDEPPTPPPPSLTLSSGQLQLMLHPVCAESEQAAAGNSVGGKAIQAEPAGLAQDARQLPPFVGNTCPPNAACDDGNLGLDVPPAPATLPSSSPVDEVDSAPGLATVIVVLPFTLERDVRPVVFRTLPFLVALLVLILLLIRAVIIALSPVGPAHPTVPGDDVVPAGHLRTCFDGGLGVHLEVHYVRLLQEEQ